MSEEPEQPKIKTSSKNLETRVGPFRVDEKTFKKFTMGLNSEDRKKINYSSLFRDLVWSKNITIVKPFTSSEIELFKKLISVSNNLNQIAKALNTLALKDNLQAGDLMKKDGTIKELIDIVNYCLNNYQK